MSEADNYYREKLLLKSDAKDRLVRSDFDEGSIKKIHLTGVCGKAMASLAGLFVAAGFEVTGSDESWNPPMSTILEKLGIRFKKFSPENIHTVDLVVVGNAYSSSNIEAIEAREKNIPQISSAEAYARFFIGERKSIVIAGTHGKTTTSALAAHVFIPDKKTNALVGGVIRNIEESYHFEKNAEYSVVEGDEYDTAYFDKAPKFLRYRPTIGIITSIEFDHADIYTDMEDYLQAFLFFAQEIPKDGYLLISDSVPAEYRKALMQCSVGTVYTYGRMGDIKILNVRVDGDRGGQYFDLEIKGELHKDFFIPLFGFYNVENVAAVAIVALKEGIPEDKVKDAFYTFKGAEQRQQVLFDTKFTLIDDFAHHPTAVRVTLNGIRDRYPNRRIIAVFEPRSATSRRKDFEVPYTEAFDSIDEAIIAKPPVKSVDTATNMMDVNVVAQGIAKRIPMAIAISTTEEIITYLQKNVSEGDVIVIMSNGHFDGLSEKLLDWLRSN